MCLTIVCSTSERPWSFPVFGVTMSSLLVVLLLVTAVCAQLRVTTSPAPIAFDTGATAVLQCMFSLGVTPVDPAQVHVFWKHEGKKILSYVDRITAFRPGAHISEEHLAKGDASLSLPNVTQEDAGMYTCSIRLGSEQVIQSVNLIVIVQPEVFFYLSSKGQKNSSLICLVSGFYPDDLNLSMKRDGEHLGCKINKWRNPNGTYSLEAIYRTNVTYKDSNIDYTCTVHHPTIPEGTTERLTFLVDAYVPKALWISAACGLLLAVIIQIFCKHVTDISVCKDWTEGSIAVLKCNISGRYPKNITAVWLIRRGDKEIEIKEKGSSYTAGDYRELQEQDNYTCWNTVKSRFVGGLRHSLCSILSFQVHKERHEQAEFICRFTRAGKVLAEKKYFGTVLDSYGFYSVSDICVPETCNEGERLTLSCIMKGNIPRDIRITWEKSLNEERTVISKELDPNYQVTENKSQGQICAFLTLCPTCEESGAVFTASFSENEGRILAERSSEPLKVAEPKKTHWSRTYQDWGFRAFDESVVTEM
ncbi:vascular endothelial growth factor receptor 1-like isoform X2 [Engystomops pustulosus]|uniref:vascular endothelial growth factor receptor 1-like isoform X2 n=1 Tax=Engystomops pustulosus TaxID=76066 RepID=UPI003AFAABC1